MAKAVVTGEQSCVGQVMTENILKDRKACYLCPVHCKRIIEVDDDMLPDRIFEPIENGPMERKTINRQQFIEMRKLAYDMLGWDRQSAATKLWKLYELGLDWVAEKSGPGGIFNDQNSYDALHAGSQRESQACTHLRGIA
jgi:aldehyde:ferredoxin oxidoreductase